MQNQAQNPGRTPDLGAISGDKCCKKFVIEATIAKWRPKTASLAVHVMQNSLKMRWCSQNRAGVAVHDMKMGTQSHWSQNPGPNLRRTPDLGTIFAPKCVKSSSLRPQLKNQRQKRAGVHVHYMQIAHWRCKSVLVVLKNQPEMAPNACTSAKMSCKSAPCDANG